MLSLSVVVGLRGGGDGVGGFRTPSGAEVFVMRLRLAASRRTVATLVDGELGPWGWGIRTPTGADVDTYGENPIELTDDYLEVIYRCAVAPVPGLHRVSTTTGTRSRRVPLIQQLQYLVPLL
jgi:hypothetical protein